MKMIERLAKAAKPEDRVALVLVESGDGNVAIGHSSHDDTLRVVLREILKARLNEVGK